MRQTTIFSVEFSDDRTNAQASKAREKTASLLFLFIPFASNDYEWTQVSYLAYAMHRTYSQQSSILGYETHTIQSTNSAQYHTVHSTHTHTYRLLWSLYCLPFTRPPSCARSYIFLFVFFSPLLSSFSIVSSLLLHVSSVGFSFIVILFFPSVPFDWLCAYVQKLFYNILTVFTHESCNKHTWPMCTLFCSKKLCVFCNRWPCEREKGKIRGKNEKKEKLPKSETRETGENR